MARKTVKKRAAPQNKVPARANAGLPASEASLFPIVGIGASAGGLEAFGRLLKGLPEDTGMAFVLVQHLDPEHGSMLTRLLAKATAMPVTEVKDGMPVEPNRVYVIPPNTTMWIERGSLYLAPRQDTAGRPMPIDFFMRSLAENESGRAIGVILSGAASDGTLGLKAIKGEGGITFAQDEKSAKYDGMPRSAIAAGCVDFVRTPEGIAHELVRLARHPYLGTQPAGKSEMPQTSDEDLHKIFAMLRASSGIDFRYYKYNTIKRRIARRMLLGKIETLPRYLKYLRENRGEIKALYEDILIHVTSFFREPETFQELKEIIIPKLLHAKTGGDGIRIWVPGCSTGEEAYSLAMVLLEALGDRAALPPVQIFGTDISSAVLDKARSGIFSESAVADVSAERLKRFFVRRDDGYQIIKPIREMCIFARQDLVKDPPFSRLDLVSCRNVLIYMGPMLQKMAMNIFHYALKASGYLVLGKAESISGFTELFAPASSKQKIYIKKAAVSRPVFNIPMAFQEVAAAEAAGATAAPARFDVQKEADKIVVAQYAPPGLVANDHHEILQFRGNVAPFLSPAHGEASLNLTRMVRPEFAVELRTALHRARTQEVPVRKEGVPIKRNGSAYSVDVEVVPFKGDTGDRYFLVLFEETKVSEEGASKAGPPKAKLSKAQETEVARLGRELQATKEYLQSIIEEQEATNEELKSANEEILSSNEELQSTNEELETAKEELQSTNEELVTVNEQLQNRNAELGQLSDDLTNLLSGVNIPILMLGNDRRIRRFTPLAERLFSLTSTDIGRPIGNIRFDTKFTDLEPLISEVMEKVSPRDQEIQAADGKWYSMRLWPYRTQNKIDGVVMVFVDIDALKRTQEALREQSMFAAAVMDSADAMVMVIDAEGRIVSFNRRCEAITGYKSSDVKGVYVWDLPVSGEDARQVKAKHQQTLAGKGPAQEETRWMPRNAPERIISWRSSVISDSGGAPRYVVRIGADVTERQRAEKELERSGAALRQSQGELQSLAAGLIHAQEAERRRISRELHDDIGQKLAALAVEGETASRSADSDARFKAKLRGVWRKLGVISEDVRRTAYQLHPSVLDHLGLAPAVKKYCADFARQEGIDIRVVSRNLPQAIPSQAALTVYRVVQEALRNVGKHSSARRASVSLGRTEDGSLILSVADQGRGFDPNRLKRRGLGLLSMEERARLAGGSLTLRAKPGEGTRVELRIPVSPPPTSTSRAN